MSVQYSGTGVTFADGSSQTTAPSGYGFKNRIINGAMTIDQRNAGASVTQTTSNVYTLDRWYCYGSVASKFTVQQNAGSVTPPAGFTAYLGATSSSAYTVTGNDSFQITQIIEGYNCADLAWGTANAQPATLSFWVRSSLTGTFGGSIATTKTSVWVMPFSYTILSANTWTYITVPIAAATGTGGTNNDNTAGIYVRFGLGATGSAAGGTSGVWTNAGNYSQPASTVSVVGTSGATFYITGVQLEKGSTATAYDYRPYGTELALCQRYYVKYTGAAYNRHGNGYVTLSTLGYASVQFPVQMRSTPSFNSNGTFISPNITPTSLAIDSGGTGNSWGNIAITGTGGTAGVALLYSNNSASTYTEWSAEL